MVTMQYEEMLATRKQKRADHERDIANERSKIPLRNADIKTFTKELEALRRLEQIAARNAKQGVIGAAQDLGFVGDKVATAEDNLFMHQNALAAINTRIAASEAAIARMDDEKVDGPADREEWEAARREIAAMRRA